MTGASRTGPDPHSIRRYRPEDAVPTLHVFDQAIKLTAAAFYTPAQLRAWNPGGVDLGTWNARRCAAWTIVVDTGDGIAGFADLTDDGVLDMLFVHPDYSSRGIARSLISTVLGEARQRGLIQVRTSASRAARPVFERAGFIVDRDNHDNMVRGQVLPNYTMHVDLR